MKKTLEYFTLSLFVIVIVFFVLVRGFVNGEMYQQSYADEKEEKVNVEIASPVENDNTSDIKSITNLSDITIDFNKKNDLLEYIIQRIKLSYVEEVDDNKIYEGALKGILSSLDPHSAYLNEKEFKEMQVQTKGEFGGLGIVVTKDSNFIKVVSPIDDTPAARAGVLAGDYISEIDGKNTFDMSLTDAVDLMRGKVGEKIKIVVLRKGETKPLEFTLRRENVKIEAVKGKIIDDGILYIRISNFIETTYKDMLAIINKNKKNLKGIILDLRNNPGGLLDQSIKISEIFLDGGKVVVSIKGRDEEFLEEYKSSSKKALVSGIPVVVLVNEGSASASEIVAGALQDHKIATIMGEKTFGKASVQQLFPLYNGGAVKLTIARYYTPLGRSIQLDGIKPDIEVKKGEIKYSENNFEIREKDLAGHLENEDIVTETINNIKKEEKQITDYQLLRALDFINGINFYNHKQ